MGRWSLPPAGVPRRRAETDKPASRLSCGRVMVMMDIFRCANSERLQLKHPYFANVPPSGAVASTHGFGHGSR